MRRVKTKLGTGTPQEKEAAPQEKEAAPQEKEAAAAARSRNRETPRPSGSTHRRPLSAISANGARGKNSRRKTRNSTTGRARNAAENGNGQPRGRGRRPAGVKTLITDVLKKSRKALRPGVLRDRVLDGRRVRDDGPSPQAFYVAVFNTAKKIPGVEHTKDGFRLKK